MSGTTKLAELIEEKDRRIAELERANANNIAGWENNVAGLQRRIAKLERDLDKAQGRNAALEREHDELRDIINDVLSTVDDIDPRFRYVTAQVNRGDLKILRRLVEEGET